MPHVPGRDFSGVVAAVGEGAHEFRPGEPVFGVCELPGEGAYAEKIAHLGARVISTASAANHEYVRGLGADMVIDYRSQDFTQLVSGCDAVLDTAGGDVTTRSFAVLRPGGRLASVAAGARAPASPRPDVTSLRPSVERNRRNLERIAGLLVDGAVRPPEIAVLPLCEAAAAHRVSEARHLRGKLVLQVREETGST